MYAVSSLNRVYIPFLFCLCAALFSSSTLASYTRTPSGLSPTVQTAVNNGLTVDQFVRSGAATVGQNSVSASKSAVVKTGLSTGSISAVQSIGFPAAKRVAGSVLRGGFYGSIIIEGLTTAVDTFQNLQIDYNEGLREREAVQHVSNPPNSSVADSCSGNYQVQADSLAQATVLLRVECSRYGQVINLTARGIAGNWYGVFSSRYCPYTQGNRFLESTGTNSSGQAVCVYSATRPNYNYIPASQGYLDRIESDYSPFASDYDALDTYLSMGEKDGTPFDLSSVELSSPAVTNQPASTTETVQSGDTTTVKTTQPALTLTLGQLQGVLDLGLSVSETTNIYEGSNLLSSTTVTTTKDSDQKTNYPQASTGSGSVPDFDFELPSFCSWASIVCNWLGWTQEPLDEVDPDLSVLISEFEPDEDEFDLGLGDGSCPAPIQLNITFINKIVEVSYQPFCDFVTMIRPFILAAAYLFAAYLYLGVLKRG